MFACYYVIAGKFAPHCVAFRYPKLVFSSMYDGMKHLQKTEINAFKSGDTIQAS